MSKPTPRRAELTEVHEGETYRDNWGHERKQANFCIVRDEAGQRHTIYHAQGVGGIPPHARKVGVKGVMTYERLGMASLWVFTPDPEAGT